MKELRRRHEFVRQAITTGVAAIESLLQDRNSQTEHIPSQLLAVNTKYKEMKILDKRFQEIIDLQDSEADLLTIFEYDQKVHFIRAHVSFARPSAVPSQVAAQRNGALSHNVAVYWHGKTAALPGDSKKTVQVDNM